MLNNAAKIGKKFGNPNVLRFNSLIFSADSTKIYNPTLKTIWFEVDDVPYSIKPGETIKL